MDFFDGLSCALQLLLVEAFASPPLEIPVVADAAGISQEVNVFRLVLLVDLGSRLEEGVYEEFEKLRDPDQVDWRGIV